MVPASNRCREVTQIKTKQNKTKIDSASTDKTEETNMTMKYLKQVNESATHAHNDTQGNAIFFFF